MQEITQRGSVSQTPIVSVFESAPHARAAYGALRQAGVAAERIGELGAEERPHAEPTQGLAGVVAAARLLGDRAFVLREMGLSDGSLRFYLPLLEAGGTALLVQPRGDDLQLQRVMRENGGVDVLMPGRDLVRGSAPRGNEQPIAAPPDVTRDWAVVHSRYRTLWAEHFGAEGGEFEEVEPIYAWAWEQANRPEVRGLTWARAEETVRGAWQRGEQPISWERALPIVRDVWEDVAETAQQPEGGRARRVPRPFDEAE